MALQKAPARKKRLNTLLKAGAKKMFGDEDIAVILSHHVSSGMTDRDIAKKYGSTAVSVRGWLQRLGIIPKSVRPSITSRLKRIGYPTWDKFFRRNMTMTHVDAAKLLDCHWTSIAVFRRKWKEGKRI